MERMEDKRNQVYITAGSSPYCIVSVPHKDLISIVDMGAEE